jgi:hypothetical protein
MPALYVFKKLRKVLISYYGAKVRPENHVCFCKRGVSEQIALDQNGFVISWSSFYSVYRRAASMATELINLYKGPDDRRLFT